MNRNMKRFFLLFTSLFLLLLLSLSLFIRFFNINDYAEWISKQISRSSGYQISFQSIEEDLYENSRFSVNGVALFIAQDEVAQIRQIKVEIGDIDLWNRALEIESVEISALDLELDESGLRALIEGEKDNPAAESRMQNTALLSWQQVRINKLRVVDLNAQIQKAGQKVQLQQANLSASNLRIAADNLLQPDLPQVSVNLDFARLKIQKSPQQQLLIKEGQLKSDLTLVSLQATLGAAIQSIELDLSDLPKVVMTDSLLDLKIDKDKVILEQLLTHVFDGELNLQAQALLAINPLASPMLAVKSITIESLLVKEMNLLIPSLDKVVGRLETEPDKEQSLLPVETIFIKQAHSENVDISSENPRFPLTLLNLNAAVQGLYLVKNRRLIDFTLDNNQDGLFALKFDLLRWFDSEIEAFSATGSLNQDEQSLQLIQEYFKTK